MATLTGNQIDLTYQGLIKLDDNGAIDPTVLKQITDGTGGSLPIQVSQIQTKFQSSVDFTGATVTGIASTDTTYTIGSNQDGANADIILTDNLGGTSKATLVAGANITLTNIGNDLTIAASGGAGGLVSGTGTNSLESALTTTVANASATDAIAIGDNSVSSGEANIAIGKDSNCGGSYATAVGRSAEVTSAQGTAVGFGANVTGGAGVALGRIARAWDTDAIGVGNTATASNLRSIAIGSNSATSSDDSICIGAFSSASANSAVAIGPNVSASTANTTTVNLFQIAGYASMNYADDAAAATGGIPLGGVYHTSGALKIRIA